MRELVVGDGYHFFYTDGGEDRHELVILDSRFLNPDFKKDRRAGVILDGLKLDELRQLYKWLETIVDARRYKLPGLP